MKPVKPVKFKLPAQLDRYTKKNLLSHFEQGTVAYQLVDLLARGPVSTDSIRRTVGSDVNISYYTTWLNRRLNPLGYAGHPMRLVTTHRGKDKTETVWALIDKSQSAA